MTKHNPHAPKPTGKDATKAIYKVQDTTGAVFGERLTWDQAWKRKEEVAGQRKSTTPRIVKMEIGEIHDGPDVIVGKSKVAKPTVSYSEAQRKASLARASANAAAAANEAAAAAAAQAVPPVLRAVPDALESKAAGFALSELATTDDEALAALLGGDDDVEDDDLDGDVLGDDEPAAASEK